MRGLLTERIARRALIAIALAGLVFGALAWANGNSDLANWCWAAGTVPVVIVLLFSMLRDFLAGRFGVDSIAFVSMAAALLLGQNLAGIIIAIMYAGGNVLEDFAVARAERDLRSLIDRAPRVAHRRIGSAIEDVPIDQVAVGDNILVRAGEIVPVDGVILSRSAILDEAGQHKGGCH
jgi:cation transport ATPase